MQHGGLLQTTGLKHYTQKIVHCITIKMQLHNDVYDLHLK